MPETSDTEPPAEPCPFTIPPAPGQPLSSRRPPLPAPATPETPLPSGRTEEEEHELRHFALALALVFAPAAILLSIAVLPGP